MKYFLFIFFMSSIGCKEQPKDNYDLNKELQECNARIEKLEIFNDSLIEQLHKCNEFIETMADN